MTTQNKKIAAIFSVYLLSIVLGNLLVFWLGRPGILITSFVFIPFDFVIRCYIHEKFEKFKLWSILTGIVLTGSLLTFLCNYHSADIAVASATGFICASFIASLFYQASIKKHAFYKVNGSDCVAIIVDSLIFQAIAFGGVDIGITCLQIFIKLLGGFLWYYILFIRFDFLDKIQDKQPLTFLKKLGDWQRKSFGATLEYTQAIDWHGEVWLLTISFHNKGASLVFLQRAYADAGSFSYNSAKGDHSTFQRLEVSGSWMDLPELKTKAFEAARVYFKRVGSELMGFPGANHAEEDENEA